MKKPNFFDFVSFLQDFDTVMRSVKIKRRRGSESDAEHCYQLAMTAWYLNLKEELNLDEKLLLKYALTHDLVEIYAGDTNPHIDTKKYQRSKSRREFDALKKIGHRFPEFSDLHSTISNFEELKDNESQLIYLIDKLLPAINTFLSKDSYYLRRKITFDWWKRWLDEKKGKIKENKILSLPTIELTIEFFRRTKGLFFEGNRSR